MAEGSVRVLQTVEHQCGYYRDRKARNLVIDPSADHLDTIFNAVVTSGFRRAGDLIFRPHCRGCQACEATRIPVDRFRPSRAQSRNLRRNDDLNTRMVPARYREEYYDLYRDYVDRKHSGGGMDNPDPEDFEGFLLSRWSDTVFLEIRQGDRLLAVAVTDRLSSGLSAVYTFWDPVESHRGLGVFAILSQIEAVRQEGLPYLYLGYWIDHHPKMHYKIHYRPIELFRDGRWIVHQDAP